MSLILSLLKFLPLVLQAVIAIEAAIPAAGQGATKKQIVLAAIHAAASVGEKSDDKLVAAVSGLVDNVVEALNKAGVFGKTA